MRILLVDDEADCLDDVESALRPTNYHIEKTVNPVSAIEMYKESHFDVVISDIRMPEMNGIDLLKQIKQYDKDARVIIMTAYGDLETAVSAINNKAYSFFGKPVDFKELIGTLRQIESELSQKDNLNIEQLKSEYNNLKNAYDQLMEYVKIIKEQ